MRVLFLTNFYLVHGLGGEEQSCQQVMEQIVKALEKRYPTSKLLLSLYRYIIGGYIYQGYREGLREFKLAGAQE